MFVNRYFNIPIEVCIYKIFSGTNRTDCILFSISYLCNLYSWFLIGGEFEHFKKTKKKKQIENELNEEKKENRIKPYMLCNTLKMTNTVMRI